MPPAPRMCSRAPRSLYVFTGFIPLRWNVTDIKLLFGVCRLIYRLLDFRLGRRLLRFAAKEASERHDK